MTLLTTSGSKEHALLHRDIFRDLTVVFHSSVLSDSPLQFSAKVMDKHLDRGDLDAVYATYSHICHLCGAFPRDVTAFDFRRVEIWMDRLVQLGEPRHIELLRRIVSDLHRCFGVLPTRAHHHAIIKGFLIADMVSDAWKWVQHLEQSQETPKATWKSRLNVFSWFSNTAANSSDESSLRGVVRLTSGEYDFFLNYFSKEGDFRSAHMLMMQLIQTGGDVAPKRHSWHLYLAAALASPELDMGSIQSVLAGMEKAGYAVSLNTLCAVSGRWPIEKWVTDLRLRSITPYTRPRTQRHDGDVEDVDILPEVIPLNKPKVPLLVPSLISDTPVVKENVDTMAVEADLDTSDSQTVPIDMPSNISVNTSSENAHDTSTRAADIQNIEVQPIVHSKSESDPATQANDVSAHGGQFGIANSLSYANIDDHNTHVEEDHHVGLQVDTEYPDNTIPDHITNLLDNGHHIPVTDAISDYKQLRRGTKLRIRIMKTSTYDASSALLAYKEYVKLPGIPRPDIELADALITILCQGSVRSPSKAHVLQAVQVYEDFVKPSAGSFEGQEAKEYARLCNILIRALTGIPAKSIVENDLASEERCATETKRLLSDMKSLGIWPDERTICSTILHRFRVAGSHKEALTCYISFTSELEAMIPQARRDVQLKQLPWQKTPVLSRSTCKAVLNAFGELSFPSSPVTPARMWFSMLSDMCSRSFAVGVADYTRYLGNILSKKVSPLALHWDAIGVESPDGEEKRIKSMYASVKYLHRKLAIDINIVPDAILLNTLMNAYQHLGAFDDAVKVFNTIWVTDRANSVTPIIAFDACGYARRSHEAAIIWGMFVRRGWKFDKKALDTWVECLCRLGEVDTACKFVCLTMGKDNAGYDSHGSTLPDEHTCAILLKLSWTVGQSADVKDKIRVYLPHVWRNISAQR
ncbi:hypothetical protein BU17DRAFT_61403 [Hysterangium stoloniferum]|nr:hypothetical protein BU17DRAFT_61403 [Hysterangium stoloniferum]